MSRRPSFDRQEVILQATEVFWQRGYRSTSVTDLVKATGLKPGSLYGAFGNKKGVFLEVLRAYQRRSAAHLDELLADSESPLNAIRRFFRELAEETLQDQRNRGCLMVNALLEYSLHEPDVQQQLSAGLAGIEDRFRGALLEARERGELDSELDIDATSAFLVNNIWGIRVMCRGRPSRDAVLGVVRTVLSTLKPQRGSMRRI